MGIEIAYRRGRVQVVGVDLDDESMNTSWRPSRVVDDVLGLLRETEDAERYRLVWMGLQYAGPLYGTAQANQSAESWLAFAQATREAVEQLAEGWPATSLAPYAGGIRRKSDRIAEVDNFPAFVVSCLGLVARRGPIEVALCENCGLPWLPERGARLCERPAPNQYSTCRTLGAMRRHIQTHGDYHRQRRRLYDRTKRGTLDESVYREWLEANRPGALGKTWVRFEDWQKGKRPKGGKQHG